MVVLVQLLSASKLLHLEVKVPALRGNQEQKQCVRRCRDGNISLVLPGDDGGTDSELACSQRVVGTLDGSSGRHSALPEVSCELAVFTRSPEKL